MGQLARYKMACSALQCYIAKVMAALCPRLYLWPSSNLHHWILGILATPKLWGEDGALNHCNARFNRLGHCDCRKFTVCKGNDMVPKVLDIELIVYFPLLNGECCSVILLLLEVRPKLYNLSELLACYVMYDNITTSLIFF